MAFFNKLKWVLGILIVFVLIVATNLIDRNNFLRVKNTVETIYEDRLVANDILFEMFDNVNQKEIAFIKLDSVFFKTKNTDINENIHDLILRFEQTKLTAKEASVFGDFKHNIQKIKQQEISFIQSNFNQQNKLEGILLATKKNLYDLSKIQLNEGSRQTSISKKAIDTVDLFTHIEIYVLIFLAIVIQIIVIYNPKEK